MKQISILLCAVLLFAQLSTAQKKSKQTKKGKTAVTEQKENRYDCNFKPE